MTEAYLGLGSNIEPRMEYLKNAAEKLNAHQKIRVKEKSSVYITKPYGYQEQDDFLNAVVLIDTALKAEELLKSILQIEKDMGRTREKEWGPRKIDIDILFYNQLQYESDDLVIPHPEITKRAFVMIPLLEIAEAGKLTIAEKPIKEWLQELNYDSQDVKLYSKFPDLKSD